MYGNYGAIGSKLKSQKLLYYALLRVCVIRLLTCCLHVLKFYIKSNFSSRYDFSLIVWVDNTPS